MRMMRQASTLGLLAGISTALLGSACQPAAKDVHVGPQVTWQETLASSLVSACPLTKADDEAARASCAKALAQIHDLTQRVSGTFYWGQKRSGTEEDRLDEQKTTKLDALVFTRLYLPLFMYDGTYRLEHTADGKEVVHLPVHFRNELSMDSFPYPFWHSEKKWKAYQTTTEILFVTDADSVLFALRSDKFDANRAIVERKWDGRWAWKDEAGEHPHVNLFTEVFSKNNRLVPELDSAYRALEGAMRIHNCASCHSPDNQADLTQLAMLIYPNQALAARHSLVEKFEQNAMPPRVGIPDEAERSRLTSLAKNFERVADAAFASEGGPRADSGVGRDLGRTQSAALKASCKWRNASQSRNRATARAAMITKTRAPK